MLPASWVGDSPGKFVLVEPANHAMKLTGFAGSRQPICQAAGPLANLSCMFRSRQSPPVENRRVSASGELVAALRRVEQLNLDWTANQFSVREGSSEQRVVEIRGQNNDGFIVSARYQADYKSEIWIGHEQPGVRTAVILSKTFFNYTHGDPTDCASCKYLIDFVERIARPIITRRVEIENTKYRAKQQANEKHQQKAKDGFWRGN